MLKCDKYFQITESSNFQILVKLEFDGRVIDASKVTITGKVLDCFGVLITEITPTNKGIFAVYQINDIVINAVKNFFSNTQIVRQVGILRTVIQNSSGTRQTIHDLDCYLEVVES